MVIEADALHYKTDLFSNGSVLIALVFISYTGNQLIDPILGIGIALYMIYSSIPIIKEGILMLLDAALPEKEMEQIIEIITSEPRVTTYHDLKTRESGSHIFISFHAVFNVDISLYEAHAISDKLEAKLRTLYGDRTTHILIHLDPYDDSLINQIEDHY